MCITHPYFLLCISYKEQSSIIGNRCTLTLFVSFHKGSGVRGSTSRGPWPCPVPPPPSYSSGEWRETWPAQDANSVIAHEIRPALQLPRSHVQAVSKEQQITKDRIPGTEILAGRAEYLNSGAAFHFQYGFVSQWIWDLPGPGIEPVSPTLAGKFFTTEPSEKPPNRLFF